MKFLKKKITEEDKQKIIEKVEDIGGSILCGAILVGSFVGGYYLGIHGQEKEIKKYLKDEVMNELKCEHSSIYSQIKGPRF